ncbi:MAG: HU family DNA-binding protein [Bacteroidaceae bacterium]|nr:HU family DNA-binding protein [Bacteroidaceae bacterium]
MLKYKVIPRKNPQTGEFLYYGALAPVTPLTQEDVATAIELSTTVTRHDIKAVLSALQEQIITALRDNKSVRLGDLGSFRPTISSKGVDSGELFRTSHIKCIRVRFVPSAKMGFELSPKNPNVRFQQETSASADEGDGNGHSASGN